MADITTAIEQGVIADSLLDDSNIIASWPSSSGMPEFGDSEGDETETAEEIQPEQETPQELEQLAEYTDEQERQTQQFEEQPQQQQAELTPGQVAEGLRQMEEMIGELGLSDPGDSLDLATALRLDPRSTDLQPLDATVSKVALSVEQMYSSGQNSGAMPLAAAQRFAHDFFSSQGVDPRSIPHDPQLLGTAVRDAAVNLRATLDAFGGPQAVFEAIEARGLPAVLQQLNSADMAENFAVSLCRAFGADGPVDRDYAVRLADAGAAALLSKWYRLGQAQQEQAESKQRAGRRTQRPARNSESGFETNADIFDGEALDLYQMEHGRL